MTKTFSKILFYLIILVSTNEIYSQKLDSVSIINLEYDSILHDSSNDMNTLFYKHEKDVLINNLGPYGSPFYSPSVLIVSSNNLLEKENEFDNKLYSLIGFKPYTNITYINASRKEQLFSINHKQAFGELLRFDFQFEKISSPGAYLNQEANNTLWDGNIQYVSKKKNYDLKLFGIGICTGGDVD